MKEVWLSAPPAPGRRPEWSELPPSDPADPVELESFAFDTFGERFTVLAGSVRGRKQAHVGKWREDAVRVRDRDGMVAIVMADGAGSAPLARVGATLAVEQGAEGLLCGPIAEPSPQAVARRLYQAGRQVIDRLAREAGARDVPMDHLASTLLMGLLAFWDGQCWLGTLQVGDGVMAGQGTGDAVTILGKIERGLHPNMTHFVTDEGCAEALAHKIRVMRFKDIRHLAFMTDGVADDFYPPLDGLKSLFGELEGLASSPDPVAGLGDWLRAERVGSYDDRSVVFVSCGES